MNLQEWATRWGVSQQAFAELAACSIVEPDADAVVGGKSEAYVQSLIRLEAPQRGVYLWRNNVGAGKLASGNFVRFGLGNDSKQLNERLKSGDLIGVRPVLITADMVGSTIGKFVSRECKKSDWRYSGSTEENAQLAWSTLINSLGGDAKIVKSVGSL